MTRPATFQSRKSEVVHWRSDRKTVRRNPAAISRWRSGTGPPILAERKVAWDTVSHIKGQTQPRWRMTTMQWKLSRTSVVPACLLLCAIHGCAHETVTSGGVSGDLEASLRQSTLLPEEDYPPEVRTWSQTMHCRPRPVRRLRTGRSGLGAAGIQRRLSGCTSAVRPTRASKGQLPCSCRESNRSRASPRSRPTASLGRRSFRTSQCNCVTLRPPAMS